MARCSDCNVRVFIQLQTLQAHKLVYVLRYVKPTDRTLPNNDVDKIQFCGLCLLCSKATPASVAQWSKLSVIRLLGTGFGSQSRHGIINSDNDFKH